MWTNDKNSPELSRRWFLKFAWATLVTPVIENITGVVWKVNALTINSASDIAMMHEKIAKSEKLVWEDELEFFRQFFNIKNDEEFLMVLEDLQNEFWTKADLILWESTLKKIYLNYYSQNTKNLPQKIKDKLKKLQENEESVDKNYFISQSIKVSGKTEVNFFKSFFWINDKEFEQKVKEIQRKFSHDEIDWVIWGVTLRDIYLNYYAKDTNKLSPEIKRRLSMHNELISWYRNLDKKRRENWKRVYYEKLNVFSKNTYYWWSWGFNKSWTFINEDLFDKVSHTISSKDNRIIVSNLNWQKVLRFYVWWKLYLATYVSPWLQNHKTSRYLKTWVFNPAKLYFSRSYPKPNWWAVMPYAVHIEKWIWLHWSDWRINWKPASHGCVRVPLFYQKEIYEKLREFWVWNVIFDTRNIY